MTSSMTSSEPPQKVLSLQKVSGPRSQYSGVRNFFSILRKKNQKWSKSTYKKKKKKKKKKGQKVFKKKKKKKKKKKRLSGNFQRAATALPPARLSPYLNFASFF